MESLPIEILEIIFDKKIRDARCLSKRYSTVRWRIEYVVLPMWPIVGDIKKMYVDFPLTMVIPHVKNMVVEISGIGRKKYDLGHLAGTERLEIICTAPYDTNVEIDVGIISLWSLLIKGKATMVGTEKLYLEEFGITQPELMVQEITSSSQGIYYELLEEMESHIISQYIPSCRILALPYIAPHMRFDDRLEHIYIQDFNADEVPELPSGVTIYFTSHEYKNKLTTKEEFYSLHKEDNEYSSREICAKDVPEFIRRVASQ
jgi:hypothetical protein